MPLPAVPVLISYLFSTVIGAKLLAIAVSWMTSPTNASTRKAYIGHVQHVREGLQQTKFSLTSAEDAELLENLDILQDSAGTGWTETRETGALVHVLRFLSWSHSKATAEGLNKLTETHLLAAYDFLEKAGLRALDKILTWPKR